MPHFLYGFSNGCTVAFHHLVGGGGKFCGVIMVSPIVEPQKKSFLTKIQVGFGGSPTCLKGFVVPHSQASLGLTGKRLSRELEKRNSFNEDKWGWMAGDSAGWCTGRLRLALSRSWCRRG